MEWLKSLKNPLWTNSYNHPKLGSLSAHLFLSNWLAHDHLHIRQIVRIKRAYLMEKSGEDLSMQEIGEFIIVKSLKEKKIS